MVSCQNLAEIITRSWFEGKREEWDDRKRLKRYLNKRMRLKNVSKAWGKGKKNKIEKVNSTRFGGKIDDTAEEKTRNNNSKNTS